MDKEDNEIGRDLREAVADFHRALKRGDSDKVDETLTGTTRRGGLPPRALSANEVMSGQRSRRNGKFASKCGRNR
jgi:hypothetical protein